MAYFNFHANTKKMILIGKLIKFYFVDNYNGISPALILEFNDPKRPIVPIREHRFSEYLDFILDYKSKNI